MGKIRKQTIFLPCQKYPSSEKTAKFFNSFYRCYYRLITIARSEREREREREEEQNLRERSIHAPYAPHTENCNLKRENIVRREEEEGRRSP